MFGGKDEEALMEGERSLIRFKSVLKDISQDLAVKISPILTAALEMIVPYIYKLSDVFDIVFSSDNVSMITNFISSIGNSVNSILGLFSNTESFKNLGSGISDLMSSLFGNLSSNAIVSNQNLINLWKTIEPDILKFVDFLKTSILPPLQSILNSYINILFKVFNRLIEDFQWFYNLIRPIFNPLGNIFKSLFNALDKIFTSIDKYSNKGGPIDIFISVITSAISPISTLKMMVDIAQMSIDAFQTKITETWQSIQTSFSDIWKSVKINFLTIVTGVVDALRELPGVKLEGWRFTSTKAGLLHKQENGNWINVTKNTIDDIDDGIITPNNQVIKTNPQDYIFAMKHPENLAAASGTYTININANVRSDNDIRQIRTQLESLMRSFNSKR